MESLRLSTTLPTTPEDLYDAWLTGKRHADMTGGPATSEKKKGGAFTAFDGYISGKHLELHPALRIVQTWRTTEFPEGAPDSKLEIRIGKAARGTQLTLLQSGIPDGQSEQYAENWQDQYFEPMAQYFKVNGVTAAPKKKASRKAPTPRKKSPAPKKKKATAKKASKKASAKKPSKKALKKKTGARRG